MPALKAEGEFRGVIVKQELRAVGQKKSPCLELTIEVSDGPHVNCHAWWRGWLTTEGGVRQMVKTVKQFAPEWDGDLAELFASDMRTLQMVGHKCRITVTKDERGYHKVDWLNLPEARREPEILGASELGMIADRFGDVAREASRDVDANEPAIQGETPGNEGFPF